MLIAVSTQHRQLFKTIIYYNYNNNEITSISATNYTQQDSHIHTLFVTGQDPQLDTSTAQVGNGLRNSVL